MIPPVPDQRPQSELEANVLSQYYTEPYVKKYPKKPEIFSVVQEELNGYTHREAIKFAEESLNSKKRLASRIPELPSNNDYKISCYSMETGTRAYYRVVKETAESYILSACHVNVHGYHRGDLRFIEVNDRTITRGTESLSVNGKLFLGDVLAVTGLALLRDFKSLDARKVTVESDPIWMASKITVLGRTIERRMVFSMLNIEDRTAVGKEHNELMQVKQGSLEINKLYYGTVFIPTKIRFYFTQDHRADQKNFLINKCSKIHQPSNPFGTIFEVKTSEALTEVFDIGQKAFKKSSVHGNEPSEIAETCVLMGYAATNALSNGRLDTRHFPMKNTIRNGRFLQFSIDNPFKNPTEGKWEAGNQIVVSGGSGKKDIAVIETAIADERLLKIYARLSKDVPQHIRFNKGLHIVSQREPLDTTTLRKRFFNELPDDSNGRKILKTIYGGAPIPKLPVRGHNYYYETKDAIIQLNQYQAEYVGMIKDPSNPIIIGSSPFGCGKSMTIVTAAKEISKGSDSMQLLVTQSNFASVNLVEIARKIKDGFRFVRYITEDNTKKVAEDCLTDFDLPILMEKVFREWALGDPQWYTAGLKDDHKNHTLNFLFNQKSVQPHQLQGSARYAYGSFKYKKNPSKHFLEDAFFRIYNPQVIITTAGSLHTLLSREIIRRSSVSTIQIDEASQLPEHTFISLLVQFPKANYGLIGDIKQLPPFCETGLEGKLKDFGIGNTMERAVAGNLFPRAMLREIYRCHPKTTGLLSELFYDRKLVTGVREADHNEFMRKRPDLWPNHEFPVLVVDNQEKGKRMGTSYGNINEKEIVHQLLEALTSTYKGYKLQESDIGIISFYKAQTSILTDSLRGKGVKCGTVDSFQGSEKEVIILCCTNETITDFMQISNRLNVAMSRAKQATIIIGNVAGLREAMYWGTIVKEAKKYGCVVDEFFIKRVQYQSATNSFLAQESRIRAAYRKSRSSSELSECSWNDCSSSEADDYFDNLLDDQNSDSDDLADQIYGPYYADNHLDDSDDLADQIYGISLDDDDYSD